MNGMNRQIKKINSGKRDEQRVVSRMDSKTSLIYLSIIGVVIAAGVVAPEIALASSFNLDKAAGGLLDPIVGVVDKHWGKGVMALGAGGAIIAQGDLKTKMYGFGAGVALGGLIMGAAKLGLGF